jgi:hypothetical protein
MLFYSLHKSVDKETTLAKLLNARLISKVITHYKVVESTKGTSVWNLIYQWTMYSYSFNMTNDLLCQWL